MRGTVSEDDVDDLLDALRCLGVPVWLLHRQSHTDGTWYGDVDLYIGLDAASAISAVRQSAGTRGWRSMLIAERIVNTPEVELVHDRVSSWSMLFARVDGAVLNLDVVIPI